MLRHDIDTCPGDPEALRARLDGLTARGTRVLAVLWQPDGRLSEVGGAGNFLIVSEHGAREKRRRERPAVARALA